MIVYLHWQNNVLKQPECTPVFLSCWVGDHQIVYIYTAVNYWFLLFLFVVPLK